MNFYYLSTYGVYGSVFDPSLFALVDGEEYNIVWDGEEFKRTAFAYTNPADNTSCVAVGNTLVTGGENNGDIFAVVCDITNGFTYFFSLETTASHTVGIYQGDTIATQSWVKEYINSTEKTVTKLDLSEYESGNIIEKYSDGSTLTYTLTFDKDGNITKITDSNGNETDITYYVL